MTNLTNMILVALLAVSLGIVVGEAFAPLSGVTTQALTKKAFDLQDRLEGLQRQYVSLEREVSNLCRTDAGTLAGR